MRPFFWLMLMGFWACQSSLPDKPDLLAVEQRPFLIIEHPTLNLRKQPNTQSYIVDKVHQGDSCWLIKKQPCLDNVDALPDYWYKVSHQGYKGWVYGAYTSKVRPQNWRIAARFDSLVHLMPKLSLPIQGNKLVPAAQLDVETVIDFFDGSVSNCEDSFEDWRLIGHLPFAGEIIPVLYMHQNQVYLSTFSAKGRLIDRLSSPKTSFEITANFNIFLSTASGNKKRYTLLPNGQLESQDN